MEYFEAANFLFDLRRFRMKPGTESTARLLAHLDDPHLGPDYIQIAGSNGKGSTAAMVASILQEAGLDVGLYTSPHLDDVRDRIQINGRPISKVAMAEFIGAVEDYVTERAADGEGPTFFEVLTAMALWHFGREDVDVAVLEVGIGGRYDATSVVEPTASAVTNVTLEHTEVLGETIGEIATDKAHVAGPDAPLVTAATGEALDAIREQARSIHTVGEDGDVRVRYEGRPDPNRVEAAVILDGPDWHVETRLSMLGTHQAMNAGVAAALARQVTDADEETIDRGLRGVHWPGRFEVVSQEPLVVLDGAHNPGACEMLAETLDEFEFGDLHIVFGAMYDKDHRGMVRALPKPDRVTTCQPDLERAEERAVLATVFEREGIDDVRTVSAVASALDRALDDAADRDCVLVTGSLYTVAEARTRWTRTFVTKRIRDLGDARRTLTDAHVTPPGVWRMRAKGVHRALKTRVQRRHAQYLKEELLSLGGECALSGITDHDEERIDIVLMGTLAQFKRLTEKLDGQSYGLEVIADELREALGIQQDPERRGHPWEGRTAVMGVLNVTPDSFHDGGEYEAFESAVARAEAMTAAGADIIDVGGESTRPGADPVAVETERDRVVPVIEQICDLDAMVAVDTRRATVARAALDAGADMLNDVSGLADPEMRFVAAEYDVPIVIMHSIDVPVDPDNEVHYDDVVEDVIATLNERVLRAESAGLDRNQIVIDPGVGFGKKPVENFEIIQRLAEFRALGCPVLVGHSHKSMFELVGLGPDEREHATVAATALAADRGADIVRVHDVAENVAAVQIAAAAAAPEGYDPDRDHE